MRKPVRLAKKPEEKLEKEVPEPTLVDEPFLPNIILAEPVKVEAPAPAPKPVAKAATAPQPVSQNNGDGYGSGGVYRSIGGGKRIKC
ncbi:hypothetical protein [Hyphomicrobium sp.]|uniref:hypothetical protein n=1 Tax=Hyphomicrobium sp. TaxID=82 RepID=UPI001D5E4FD9|nr:hypothetical protein [Hyphomicrobium sp.]MBY0560005.1 hypothetical protein [Hyphomicrobium sp.]